MFHKIAHFISHYFRVLFIGAVVIGLVFPSFASGANPYLGVLMSVIMFISALKIDINELRTIAKNPKPLFMWLLVSMVVMFGLFIKEKYSWCFAHDLKLGEYPVEGLNMVRHLR